jgi:hypothetical protein
MRYSLLSALLLSLVLSAGLNAATVSFLTDPFAGSDALTTPGRQVVGGEPTVNFSTATDVYLFEPTVFGINEILFAADVAANLPTGGVNTIVLQTTDNDDDPTTPFGAGNAANLIAGAIETPGPGFFVYFNSGLNLPRLVYSTDLSDEAADLKILARMANFTGDTSSLTQFSASNFAIPEPSTFVLMGAGIALGGVSHLVRRRRSRT